MAKNRSIWTREQEEELSELFQRFKDENGTHSNSNRVFIDSTNNRYCWMYRGCFST